MARSSSIGSIGSTACAGAEGSVMESSLRHGPAPRPAPEGVDRDRPGNIPLGISQRCDLPLPPNRDQRVLNDILGIRGIAENSHGGAHPVAAPASDELVEILRGIRVHFRALSIFMIRSKRWFV